MQGVTCTCAPLVTACTYCSRLQQKSPNAAQDSPDRSCGSWQAPQTEQTLTVHHAHLVVKPNTLLLADASDVVNTAGAGVTGQLWQLQCDVVHQLARLIGDNQGWPRGELHQRNAHSNVLSVGDTLPKHVEGVSMVQMMCTATTTVWLCWRGDAGSA